MEVFDGIWYVFVVLRNDSGVIVIFVHSDYVSIKTPIQPAFSSPCLLRFDDFDVRQ